MSSANQQDDGSSAMKHQEQTTTFQELIHQYFMDSKVLSNELSTQMILGMQFLLLPDVFNHIQPSADYWAQCVVDSCRQDVSVLDMGCGCGLVSMFAGQYTNRIMAVDINPAAVKNTKVNCLLHEIQALVCAGHLFQPVSDMKFDIIYFNPPWFQGEASDVLSKAWFGGKNWDVVTDFLREARNHLSSQGIIYLYTARIGTANSIADIAMDHGYCCEVYQRFPFLELDPQRMDFEIIKLSC